jgi:pyruvate formate-lyase activating enzyme-like uncharacterized protein
MSLIKEFMSEQEKKRQKQLEGYKKMLFATGTYNMDCPYCCNALSNYDVKKEQCIHCGYIFKWS